MIVKLDLNPETEHNLLTQARERGVSIGDYLYEILSRQLSVAAPSEPSPKRLIDVLSAAPFVGSELDIRRSKDYPRPVDL